MVARAILIAGVLLLASGASGQPAVPALTGRVVDLADVLSPEAEATITERLRALEDSTTEQIAVLTVPSLNGENLEEWATEVFRTWGLGQADQNNGVLVLVARDDRKIRIEVGYGLEALLTDATSGAIIRNEMTPRFRDGDFDGGAMGAVEAIIGSLDGTYVPPPEAKTELSWTAIFFLLGIPLCIVWFVSSDGYSEGTEVMESGLAGLLLGGPLAFVLFVTTRNGWSFAALLLLPLALYAQNEWLERHPVFGPKRRQRRKVYQAINAARRRGKTSVVVDGVTHNVPVLSTSSGSGGGSSFSSSFSGGGGSSGGGGASGGW